LFYHKVICSCCWLCKEKTLWMLSVIKNLSHFLIYHFWLCSSDISSELLLMQKKWSTRLFLTSIICHVDSWATRLRVFSTTIVELNEFAKLRKFVNFKEFVEFEEFIKLEEFIESAKLEDNEEFKNCKNVQLYLDAFEYLNDLFL